MFQPTNRKQTLSRRLPAGRLQRCNIRPLPRCLLDPVRQTQGNGQFDVHNQHALAA